MSLADVRAGLATRLSTITGLMVYTTVTPTPQIPCAFIRPTSHEYDLSMANGQDIQRYDVTLLAATAGTPWDVSQNLVDAYLSRSGSLSIKAAIEADRTLGGAAHTVRVVSWQDYGTLAFGAVEYFGVRFVVEVWPL
jgi:hypothetical protein